jgi:hypothetical protein
MGRCDTNKEQTLYTRPLTLLSSHCIIVATHPPIIIILSWIKNIQEQVLVYT